MENSAQCYVTFIDSRAAKKAAARSAESFRVQLATRARWLVARKSFAKSTLLLLASLLPGGHYEVKHHLPLYAQRLQTLLQLLEFFAFRRQLAFKLISRELCFSEPPMDDDESYEIEELRRENSRLQTALQEAETRITELESRAAQARAYLDSAVMQVGVKCEPNY